MLISFCTVCRNRLHHYKKTIVKNLSDNEDFEDLEFVLLDYNSEDGLEHWVKDNLYRYIETKRLKYYKTLEPLTFRRSHSRNMAFRLASGDLICNIDADNYTGKGFASYIAESFRKSSNNIFLCVGSLVDSISFPDAGGRICVKRDDFYKVGGYDEKMETYGFEDFDLINRLELAGLKKEKIDNLEFLNVIMHEIKSRIKEEPIYKTISNVFISYVSPTKCILIFTFCNQTYIKGCIVNDRNKDSENINKYQETPDPTKHEFILEDGCWETGRFECNHDAEYFLKADSQNTADLKFDLPQAAYVFTDSAGRLIFHKLEDQLLIHQSILFYSEITNRMQMDSNLRLNIINPNINGMGKGEVYRNFDYSSSILL